MRTKIFGLLVLLIIGSISCRRKKDILPIPLESSYIIKINTQKIGRKLILEKLSDFSLKDLLGISDDDSISKETIWEKILSNPKNVGIDYLEPVYIFGFKDETFSIIQLDNSNKLQDFFQDEQLKTTSKNGYSFVTINSTSIAWNKKHAILQWNKKADKLSEILNLKKEQLSIDDIEFQNAEALNDDIICLIKPEKLIQATSFVGKLKLANPHSSLLKINFEKGSVTIVGDSLINTATEKLFKPLNAAYTNVVASTSSLLNLNSNIDSKLWNRLDSDTNNELQKNLGISQSMISEGLTGEIYLILSKINLIKKTFTTYEMDEDFNKIEKTDTLKYYDPSFNFLIPVRNIASGKQILEAIKNKGLLSYSPQGYTFDLYNYPVILSIQDNYIIGSDSLIAIKPNTVKNKILTDCFLLEIKQVEEIKKLLFPNLDLSTIESLIIKGAKKNERLELNAKIQFKEKNKNGLLLLIEQLKANFNKTSVI